MYLVAIHVPIHVDGSDTYLDTDWLESLRLLRDSLEGRFGELAVIAPSRAYNPDESSQALERVNEGDEGIELISSFDNRCRSRHYWLKHRTQWNHQLRETIARADVVHAGLDDLYRPISYAGFLEGRRQGRATVFVQDTDIVVQCRQLNAHRDALHRGLSLGYSKLFERYARDAVSTASLSLLKGQDLMDRYRKYQLNAKLFHDTSYSIGDVIDEHDLAIRCDGLDQRLRAGDPPRFVYCGRLTPRKGILDSIEIVAKCHQLGFPVEFDIIGHGEQKADLAKRIDELGMGDSIRMLGRVAYGDELFARLRTYDGLLFTPLAEDTPRMIFDGYASGLPLIAYDIAYCVERQKTESASTLLPQGDWDLSAQRLIEAVKHPTQIRSQTIAARKAAVYHAAENWYQRRAEWTFEAVDRHYQTHPSGPMEVCA